MSPSNRSHGRGGAGSRGDFPLLLQLPLSLDQIPGEMPAGLSGARGAHSVSTGSTGGGSVLLGWKRKAVLLVPPGLLERLPLPEVQAILALALAPMALPGGGGWRLDVDHSVASTSRGGDSSPPVASDPAACAAPGPPALADVATAATLGTVCPSALVEQLPPELRVSCLLCL